MDSSKLTLLNVRQPWAWALVNGIKNVENRSRDISAKNQAIFRSNCVAIVASKSKPTTKDMEELYNSIICDPALQEIKDEILQRIPTRDSFVLGAIVGLVRFTQTVTASNSIWYHPGDYGWMVGSFISFPCPIKDVKGCQAAFVRLDTNTHQKDKERILVGIEYNLKLLNFY